jgi:hypothetical protein
MLNLGDASYAVALVITHHRATGNFVIAATAGPLTNISRRFSVASTINHTKRQGAKMPNIESLTALHGRDGIAYKGRIACPAILP